MSGAQRNAPPQQRFAPVMRLAACCVLTACNAHHGPRADDTDSGSAPAARDGGGGPQRSGGDGGLTIPEERWSLPPCAVEHGVVARERVGGPEEAALVPRDIALQGERLIVAYDGASPAWGELRDGAFASFELPPDADSRVQAPQRIVLGDDNGSEPRGVHAFALVPSGEGVPRLLDRKDGTTQVRELRDLLDTVWNRYTLRSRPELANYGWDLAFVPGLNLVSIIGEWSMRAQGKPERVGLAGVTLAADGTLMFGVDWRPGDAQDARAVPLPGFTQEFGSASLLQTSSPDGGALLEFEYTTIDGIVFPQRIDPAEHGLPAKLSGLTAAIDSSTGLVAVGWFGEATDARGPLEVAAAFPLRRGQGLDFAAHTAHGSRTGVRYLAHPDGGIDVLAFGVASIVPLEQGYRGDEPLDLYLGLTPPVRTEQETPMRIGAGGTAWDAVVTRDGGRIAVVWLERGPESASDSASGERDRAGASRRRSGGALQSLYYAVLDCD